MEQFRHPEVDRYIQEGDERSRIIMCQLRSILLECDPELRECFEYGRPIYRKGEPLMAMWRSSDHVNLGFLGGAGLRDERGMLEGREGEHRHVKIFSPGDLVGDLVVMIERSLRSVDINGP